MSERTLKLPGWKPQGRPKENEDMIFHRRFLTIIIFGLFNRKKEMLDKMGMPPQPISLREIYLEYESRREMYWSMKSWIFDGKTYHRWPFKWHQKRWIDRRVNEIATPKYAEDGKPKIVAATAGFYEPSPELFGK